MKIENVVTIIKNPRLAGQYGRWIFEKRFLGRAPQKRIRDSVTIGGFSGFSEYLAVENFMAENEYQFFRNHTFGPGCIVDVGANIGVLSLFLANRFPDRTIHAIEPNPFTARSLADNVALNRAQNVLISELAGGNKAGSIRFSADPVSRGTASIASTDHQSAIEVPCTTLDKFVADQSIQQIALLKVDVEGYETLVFRGAIRTLEQLKPSVIYFEVFPEATTAAGFDPEEPSRILKENGYRLYELGKNGDLRPVELSYINGIQSSNWVACQSCPSYLNKAEDLR